MTGRGGRQEREALHGQRPLLADGGTTYTSTNVYQLDWSYTVHLETGPVEFSFKRPVRDTDNPDVETFLTFLTWNGIIPDDRAEWHRNYTPLDRWVKAHILRLIRGDTHSGIADYLRANPLQATELGFYDDDASAIEEYDDSPDNPGPAGYSQLYDIWNDTFTPRTRAACQIIAERLVQYAREKGFPAPEDVFRPEPVEVDEEEPDEDTPTVRELTTKKTGEIWNHARPMVLDHWHLKRHHNWQVPEETFFDAHAGVATASDDVFPESALGNMVAKSDHDRVHYPSTHRKELKRFDIEEIRELHRSVTKDLIREARRKGELVGNLQVAIDVTKGHPWTGHVERHEDGSNAEKWVLGYRNDNDQRAQYYFQWASIQVVGLDIPLVLDAVPVHRGYTRAQMVDDLLTHATEMVDDIEVVYMDGDYDSLGVKNTVEKYDTLYVNRKSRDDTDKERMREMWENGEAVRIYEEEDRLNKPPRKTVYVPHIAVDEDLDEDEDMDEEEMEAKKQRMRQQLLDDFDGVGDSEGLPDESPFKSLLSDIHDDEDDITAEEDSSDDEDEEDEFDASEMYVAFETNSRLADKRGAAGRDAIPKNEQRHAAARLVRRYNRRWGIENGYKKLGHFLPRSGSKDENLRFFGFAFAATLYNCWRLVDLLVKLSVEDDPEYTPLVTASRFLAVAEGQFGLEAKPPPD